MPASKSPWKFSIVDKLAHSKSLSGELLAPTHSNTSVPQHGDRLSQTRLPGSVQKQKKDLGIGEFLERIRNRFGEMIELIEWSKES